MAEKNSTTLRDQLSVFVRLAGADSPGWIVAAIAGAVVLAGLDMAGVAAMVPLMTLFTAADPATGPTALFARILGTEDVQTLTLAIAGFVALVFVLKSACTIPFRWWLLGRTQRIAADAGTELMRRYVLSPYIAHRARSGPEIYRNVGDSTSQASSVLLGVVGVVSDLLVLVAILGVLFLTAPLVTLFTILFFGMIVMGVQRALRRRQTRTGEELAEAGLHGWEYLVQAIDGFREVRLTSSGGDSARGYGRARRRVAEAARSLMFISELPKYVLEIAFIVAIGGVAGILFMTGTQATALTVLGVFAAASLRALPTLNRVSATLAQIRSGQVGLGIFVEAVRDLDAHEPHVESPRTTEAFRGDIRLEALEFRFPDADDEIIRGVDLVIPENTTVALVGSSGAGKSTILDLILGLLTPTRGRVTSGGRPIEEDLASWYSRIGVVPQDVFIRNATLAENVAFGSSRPEIDDMRVIDALRLAELLEFVDTLPEGIETVMGERGVRLSGGQRQRLGLARALYSEPNVLVLDEATSALDNETEHRIANTLQRLSGRLTIVIVAHRLSTVRRADLLVFLEQGEVAAQGTFDEVRATNSHFERLVTLGELN